jgi:hypothetical protein
MPWSALGNVASSVIGGLFGRSSQAFSARHAMKMQQRQFDWQERMRATQYQTAMQDMRAAGLNPLLAAGQGGAGTPSGAAGAGISNAPPLSPVDFSAMALQRRQKDLAIEQTETQRNLTDLQGHLANQAWHNSRVSGVDAMNYEKAFSARDPKTGKMKTPEEQQAAMTAWTLNKGGWQVASAQMLQELMKRLGR